MHKNTTFVALTLLFALSNPTLAQAPVQFGANFYEFVAAPNMTWQNALTAASNRTHLGVNGHLATITSANEGAFLVTHYGGSAQLTGVWFAGQVDASGLGTWATGPEIGQSFSMGQTPTAGAYSNWGGIEPNNAPSFTWMNIGPVFAGIAPGQWADDDNGVPSSADPVIGYFVEYEFPRWQRFGAGCTGPAGVPFLDATTPPDVGISETVWPGFGPLPFDFASFGAPNCFAHCDVFSILFRPNIGGNGTHDMPIPNAAGLAGLVFYLQAYVFDQPANTIGITSSNAGRAFVL